MCKNKTLPQFLFRQIFIETLTMLSVKVSHREKVPSNKTTVIKKVGIWAFRSLVHQINSL